MSAYVVKYSLWTGKTVSKCVVKF